MTKRTEKVGLLYSVAQNGWASLWTGSLELRLAVAMLLALAVGVGCGSSTQKVSDVVSSCGQSIDQLKAQNDISDACRSSIQSLLSSFSSNFKGKLYVSSALQSSATGRAELYLSGVKANGDVISASEFASASIVVSLKSGTVTTLTAAEVSASTVAVSTTSVAGASLVASVSFVMDYSGSMREADLSLAADIFGQFVTYAPAAYEAEVLYFSKLVTQKQSFSSSTASITAALAKDTSVTRSSTALYDGVGTGVAHLAARSQPVKILFVATDGLENSSTTYTKSTAIASIASEKVFVVAMGTLFSDQNALKDLAGSRGVYFYGDALTTIQSNLGNFMKSFASLSKVSLPASVANASTATVSVAGVTADISF